MKNRTLGRKWTENFLYLIAWLLFPYCNFTLAIFSLAILPFAICRFKSDHFFRDFLKSIDLSMVNGSKYASKICNYFTVAIINCQLSPVPSNPVMPSLSAFYYNNAHHSCTAAFVVLSIHRFEQTNIFLKSRLFLLFHQFLFKDINDWKYWTHNGLVWRNLIFRSFILFQFLLKSLENFPWNS